MRLTTRTPGPPAELFSNLRFSSCQENAVEISWDYPVPDPPKDFAGFRIEIIWPGAFYAAARWHMPVRLEW